MQVARLRATRPGSGAGWPTTLVVLTIAVLSLSPFVFLLLRSLTVHGDIGVGGLWLMIFDRMRVGLY